MNAKLGTIIMYVKNVPLLRNFYVDHFNLKVIEEDLTWVLLDAGGAHIGLHKIGDQYLENIEAGYLFDNNTKLVFEIDIDIESARDEMVSKNI